jgi:glucosamine--fructose-6-phosphate aminotransferase (isomerizing)
MCGIVGYCGPKKTTEVLLEGLKRLEYRGYDSSGVCWGDAGELKTVKRSGKIINLRDAVKPAGEHSYGIGHTRWATHGVVNEANAHPHLSSNGKIAIVHNGIIENYESLKHRLQGEGHTFKSDTDSEVIAHLLEDFYEDNLEKAMSNILGVIKGTYGIVAIHADEPNKLVGVRNGSPLVLGVGNGEMYLGSDVAAMVAYTKQVIYLEDGEMVVVTPEQFETFDLRNRPVDKKISVINWQLEEMEKGNFPHFMLKEIFEQPESIARAFQGRLDPEQATAKLGGLNMSSREILRVERVKIIAAGTSFHAGMVGAYLLETLARIPATAELASEVRYRNPIVEKDALYFAISQSGETADTLYAMRELQRKGATVLGIVNVVGSTIARESDGGVYIHSGPEIAVASTKAFTSQITVFFLLTLLLGRMKNMSFPKGQKFIRGMEAIGPAISKILEKKEAIHQLAKRYAHYPDFLFLGRGLNYPVALEGALKLKEISYIHAEGYSAAEIKHGPIALINEDTPSVFLVPNDFLREKVISNMKEIKARKGLVIAICEEGDEEVNLIADDTIEVPSIGDLFTPYTMIIPLQLFSYYCALELGRDVDQPRNLAKSVTVE